MLVRHDLFLLNFGWLFPSPPPFLNCPETFPEDLLPDLPRERVRMTKLLFSGLSFWEVDAASVFLHLLGLAMIPLGFLMIPRIWASSDLTINSWVLPYLLLVVFLILEPSLNTETSETLMVQTKAKYTLPWPYHCSLSLNHPLLSASSPCLPCLAVCVVFVLWWKLFLLPLIPTPASINEF